MFIHLTFSFLIMDKWFSLSNNLRKFLLSLIVKLIPNFLYFDFIADL